MERYIGLDVHSTCTTGVVLGPSGRKTKEVVIETTAAALREFVKSVRRPSVVVLEEGNQSEWICEILWPLVDDCLVVQPERPSKNKNDSTDAGRLARLVRLGEPGRVIYKAPRTLVALRRAAKVYRTTKKDLTRSRVRLKLFIQSRGLLPKTDELLDPDDRQAWIELVPPDIQPRGVLLGAQVDAMTDIHGEATAWMLSEARKVRAVSRLKSVPGIGEIWAPQIVSVMISPYRFRTKRQLWRYAGLAVRSRSSRDWVQYDGGFVRRRRHEQVFGLNRDRNPVLKEAFGGAARTIISQMRSHPLHKRYQERIAQGMKPGNSRLTLTRTIAAIVLAIWKKKEKYDPAMS